MKNLGVKNGGLLINMDIKLYRLRHMISTQMTLPFGYLLSTPTSHLSSEWMENSSFCTLHQAKINIYIYKLQQEFLIYYTQQCLFVFTLKFPHSCCYYCFTIIAQATDSWDFHHDCFLIVFVFLKFIHNKLVLALTFF